MSAGGPVFGRAGGCIGLRAVAKSLRRSFRWISDHYDGNVQRIGCDLYFTKVTGGSAARFQ